MEWEGGMEVLLSVAYTVLKICEGKGYKTPARSRPEVAENWLYISQAIRGNGRNESKSSGSWEKGQRPLSPTGTPCLALHMKLCVGLDLTRSPRGYDTKQVIRA